ncbi:zinc dependent phospholipase C family protein [Clostridium felsineum]|uniref:zinc dependent phospholipase C family protein n=1 Tax=Clostridium felsineum TaxID=36839 RepID=UPI00098CB2DE|nr:zinc dependent phospholipase C family protein [Clostridium felsineum]URZ17440.1 hypothetical protein CLFE_034930 [Clostridium felsineum DSM 794]
MITDTHLLFSHIIYKEILRDTKFKLDKIKFALGNIKPDFSNKEMECPHTLNESLESLIQYADGVIKSSISVEEFSISLGVICHYICDYFCLYHREGNEKKGILEHFIYELKLEYNFIVLLFNGRLDNTSSHIHGYSIEEIVLNIEKEYNIKMKGVSRDINYALNAAMEVSKLIVYSSMLYNEKYKLECS